MRNIDGEDPSPHWFNIQPQSIQFGGRAWLKPGAWGNSAEGCSYQSAENGLIEVWFARLLLGVEAGALATRRHQISH